MCESTYYLNQGVLTFEIRDRNDLIKIESARKEHENNELHKFCRNIESLTSAGIPVMEAYRLVRERYQ